MKAAPFDFIGLSPLRLLLWLGLFAIAMGFLEAIVVVYLRMLFFPGGFSFPLSVIPSDVLLTEIIREAATLLMIVGLAAVSGRSFLRRLGAFLFTFGVWDVFYYVALKLFLGWPPSFMTWDVLFLIPVTWLGPVLAPLVVAVTMAGFGAWLIIKEAVSVVRISPRAWGLMCSGAFIIFCTFVSDYTAMIAGSGLLPEFFRLYDEPEFIAFVSGHVPDNFSWGWFLFAEGLALAGIWFVVRSHLRWGK